MLHHLRSLITKHETQRVQHENFIRLKIALDTIITLVDDDDGVQNGVRQCAALYWPLAAEALRAP